MNNENIVCVVWCSGVCGNSQWERL